MNSFKLCNRVPEISGVESFICLIVGSLIATNSRIFSNGAWDLGFGVWGLESYGQRYSGNYMVFLSLSGRYKKQDTRIKTKDTRHKIQDTRYKTQDERY